MEKMKILQVNKLYFPEIGGIEKAVQQISEGMKDKADLKVLVCQKKGKGIRETVNGVRVYRAHSFGVVSSVPISFSFFRDLRRLSKDADIIQFHMPFPLADLACLLSGYRGKVVAYWHSDVVKQKKWMLLYRPVMERFLKRTDLILVGSHGTLKGSHYLKPYLDKCRVIPYAVSEQILQDGGRFLAEHGYRERESREQIHFLFIGRLVYYKGCSFLLEAFAKLAEKNRTGGRDGQTVDVALTVIGDGALRQEMEQKAKELNVYDQIHFLGKADDKTMKASMEQADVFVLPSIERSESFGLVQLEAMAYGIPVINTQLPSGVPEVSLHGQTGLTVQPADADALADAMEWMCRHPEERRQMGIAARERVEECFTEERLVTRLMKVYTELLQE